MTENLTYLSDTGSNQFESERTYLVPTPDDLEKIQETNYDLAKTSGDRYELEYDDVVLPDGSLLESTSVLDD